MTIKRYIIAEEATGCFPSVHSVHRTEDEARAELIRLCGILQRDDRTVEVGGAGTLTATAKDGYTQRFAICFVGFD